MRPLEHPFFPPLAMGVLFEQLKLHGYDVSQDDLSIRVHHDAFNNGSINKQSKLSVFFQKERIVKYVESGIDLEIDDQIERILKNITIKDIDIYLLSIPESIHNPSNILFAMALSKFLKKKYVRPIVVGGDIHATRLLQTQYDVKGIIDYIVIGVGEEAIVDIVDRIISGRDRREYNKVQIVKKHHNKIFAPDFSGLPFEKYSFSSLNYKDYYVKEGGTEILKDFFTSNVLILPFQFIKGCPNQCAFCSSSTGEVIALAPEEMTERIKFLQERFHPTAYLFLNDTINISKEYIEKICDALCENDTNILWSDCVKVSDLDENVIAKMRRAGCVRAVLGMETASSNLLSRINKGITIEALENVLKLAYKYGIWTGVEVICGLPHETETDINTTIDFLLDNSQYIDRIYCNIFDLRENSLMSLYPQRYGIENVQTINLYSASDSESVNRCNFMQYSFDEIGGLKGEEKKKQMVESYSKVIKLTKALDILPTFLEEQFLFYLYSRFDDKSIIKKHYQAAVKCFIG